MKLSKIDDLKLSNNINNMKLMYITNKPDIAKIADDNGVDWIFIDLEINGKIDRQGHLDTVISRHDIEDIRAVKKVIKKAKLLVRINPIFYNSKSEIDKVIEYGSDIIMLPYFKTTDEVKKFINYVDGRVKTCLLLETPEAVEGIDNILEIEGIDYIHIGLNDLHLGYKLKFMFELISNGTVENLINKIKEKNIPYGFGGIAKLGEGIISAENILMEHYRLGSEMVILSRSFCNTDKITNIYDINDLFSKEVALIRRFELKMKKMNKLDFIQNHHKLTKDINEVVKSIEK